MHKGAAPLPKLLTSVRPHAAALSLPFGSLGSSIQPPSHPIQDLTWETASGRPSPEAKIHDVPIMC